MRPFIILLITLCSLTTLAQPTHSPITPAVPYEVRAVWLTTLMGLDWPKQPARNAEQAEAQQKALCQMLDKMKEAGINTVLFQARIRSTTAYPSAIEPWDGVFTGTPGKRPSYDPLKLAVDECHKRGMECHAWVVAFPICKVAIGKQLGKAALPNVHPELCQKCGDQWMMDPGVPGTAPYIASICQEIVKNYDVDGIHLDYIRYPEELPKLKTLPREKGRENITRIAMRATPCRACGIRQWQTSGHRSRATCRESPTDNRPKAHSARDKSWCRGCGSAAVRC